VYFFIYFQFIGGPRERKRKAEEAFKMAPDGRLVITDGDVGSENEEDDEEELIGTNDDDDEEDLRIMEKMVRPNAGGKRKGTMSGASVASSRATKRSNFSQMSSKSTRSSREKKQGVPVSNAGKRRRRK